MHKCLTVYKLGKLQRKENLAHCTMSPEAHKVEKPTMPVMTIQIQTQSSTASTEETDIATDVAKANGGRRRGERIAERRDRRDEDASECKLHVQRTLYEERRPARGRVSVGDSPVSPRKVTKAARKGQQLGSGSEAHTGVLPAAGNGTAGRGWTLQMLNGDLCAVPDGEGCLITGPLSQESPENVNAPTTRNKAAVGPDKGDAVEDDQGAARKYKVAPHAMAQDHVSASPEEEEEEEEECGDEDEEEGSGEDGSQTESSSSSESTWSVQLSEEEDAHAASAKNTTPARGFNTLRMLEIMQVGFDTHVYGVCERVCVICLTYVPLIQCSVVYICMSHTSLFHLHTR